MKVKIKKLTDNAKIPTQAHDKDFCYDVYATSCEEVEPGIWKYGIGLAFEIVRDEITVGVTRDKDIQLDFNTEKGYYHEEVVTPITLNADSYSLVKLSIDFRPRSSVWKTGMILSNCEGTLDELYRGEVMAYFYEVIPGKEKYKVGDRIGQIKLGFTLPIEFEEGEINTNTERGTGGFGSTGR